ncbi:HTH-type transcriptional activator RhaS [Gemmata sp. SH-PL17]|uniref:AraC family transcriptional regulator n=1 Tax=Gemmata sp. SH-PL17 TaxID=1630693 RepID=UPI00078CD3D6|nr:AraC family transcriptional regulator [Gemmata sp. SH-PL17]AMV25319.1 HTH-type transcriptional activator RhaS [Gemmata sp. SH-PL17]
MATDELARLVAAIERHAPSDGVCRTAVPGLIIARLPEPSAPNALVVDPSLCIVAQGAKEVFLAGEVYRYDPAHSLLVSVDLPISARVVEATPARPCLAVRLSLDPSVVGELLAECPDARSPGPPARGVEVSPVEPQLLDAVGRLVSLLDSPHTLGPLAPLVLREITFRVLIGPQGTRLRQIATVGAPAQQIARAIRWLRDHFADPLPGEALARQAQMSLSGFHQHFKAVTGLSPLQYQKQLRLQEARRLMLGEGLDAAGAALRVGYESPSQFSREYRRLFGASPRRDVAALKAKPQPSKQSGQFRGTRGTHQSGPRAGATD